MSAQLPATQATAMLLSACNDYINHHQNHFNDFSDWFLGEYEAIKRDVLALRVNQGSTSTSSQALDIEAWDGSNEMLLTQIGDIDNRLKQAFKLPSQHIVFDVLPPDSKGKISPKPHEAPFSTRLHNKLESIKSMTKKLEIGVPAFIHNLTKDRNLSNHLAKYSISIDPSSFSKANNQLIKRLHSFGHKMEAHNKVLAVLELRETLLIGKSSHEHKLHLFKEHLIAYNTLDILSINPQSQMEKTLKLLSVISIVIGIGIFSTACLAAKRLYETHGRSINFFKPLSKELADTASSILSQSNQYI